MSGTIPGSTIVVGGGVAGAAAAILLGRGTTLFEREPGPHDKVCGEFVSWEAADALHALGLDLPALGALPIRTVRLVHAGRAAEATLPRPGWSLSRRTLDEALLLRATAAGAMVLRGHAVRAVSGHAVEAGPLRAEADRVLLATGKHDLRAHPRRHPANGLVGFKTYLRLAAPQHAVLAGTVEIVLFPGGYAGLQQAEGGRANLCLLIGRDALATGPDAPWSSALAHIRRHAPHLRTRLDGATELLSRPLAIARIPYGFVNDDPAGPARLGDQAATIPSFSGDGIAVALHTAFAAAAEPDPARFAARMRAELGPQIARAFALHRTGLRHPAPLVAAARFWPGALRLAARLTRVHPGRLSWRPAP